MKRLLVLAMVCSFFAAGFTSCDPDPKLSCSNPTKLTDYQGTLHYPNNVVVQQDVWSPRNGTQQTMYVCGPASWKAIVKQTGQPSDGVATYPDSQKNFTNWSTCASQPLISSFTKLQNTYGFALPNAGSWDATTDVFTDGAVCGRPLTEIMVLHRWRDVDFPTPQDRNVTIAGVVYDVFHASGFVQLYQVQQRSSGTFDLLAVLRWCQSKGYLPANATMTFDAEGVEILTTFGAWTPFYMTDFAVSAVHS